MPTFGIAGDPNLWEGQLYQEEPEGYLVSRYGATEYLPRDLAYVPGTEWGDDATWATWQQEYGMARPQQGGLWARFTRPPKKVPLRPPGGVKVPIIILSLLTIKLQNVVVVAGTGTGGINVKAQNASVVSGGTATIAVSNT